MEERFYPKYILTYDFKILKFDRINLWSEVGEYVRLGDDLLLDNRTPREIATGKFDLGYGDSVLECLISGFRTLSKRPR